MGDKCCIDQHNIQENLSALPVFVAACSRLLIVMGDSYLSRMWCVLELFTFVHMGGDMADVEILFIGSRCTAVRDFDVRNCRCTNPEDLATIMSIVNACCDVEKFNKEIQTLLSEFHTRS